jgi:hypothetical protein
MLTADHLWSIALDRLMLVNQHNPGFGIIPHPYQEYLYEQLLAAGLCTVIARAWRVGEVGSLENRSDRRSYHYKSE